MRSKSPSGKSDEIILYIVMAFIRTTLPTCQQPLFFPCGGEEWGEKEKEVTFCEFFGGLEGEATW
jgi:hypothetical protein